MTISLPSFARRRLALLLPVTLLACADDVIRSSDVDPSHLTAHVTLTVDAATRRVEAVGTVSFDDPSEDAPGAFGAFGARDGTVRLVDGDRLTSGWDGAAWTLYRRSAAYRYRTAFTLPPDRVPMATIALGRSGTVVRNGTAVPLPDTTTFRLAEAGATLASDATLELSWALGSGVASVADIRPLSCVDAAGLPLPLASPADVASRVPLDPAAANARLPLDPVFAPARDRGAARCRYAIRLEAGDMAVATGDALPDVRLDVIALSPVATFEIIDAVLAGGAR